MTTTIDPLALEVLNRGLDDWLYLAEVEYLVRSHHGGEAPSSIKGRCFALVEYLLANRFMSVGDLLDVNGKVQFLSWDKDVDESLREVERRWDRFGGPRDETGANDVCWLSNTEEGDALARRVTPP